jgi:hypothetical protein
VETRFNDLSFFLSLTAPTPRVIVAAKADPVKETSHTALGADQRRGIEGMTTTDSNGDKPVAPVRRTKTAAAQGEPTAPQADSAAPRHKARVPATPKAEPVDPYRSCERVWPD